MKKNKVYGRKEIRSIPKRKLRLTTFGKVVVLGSSIAIIISIISVIKGKEELQIIDVTTSEKVQPAVSIEDLENVLDTKEKQVELSEEVKEVTIVETVQETYKIPLDKDILEFIKDTSSYYNLDYNLVLALIRHESNFNEAVIGNNESYGLMQIHRINHNWLKDELNISDFLDPYDNIEAGCHMLSELFEKYEDETKVLMAYNFGEAGAKRQWEQGINNTDFTMKVLETKFLYSLGKEVD